MPDEKKQMWIILRAKDATKIVFKDMKKTGMESVKALKQGFKALKVAVLGFATAILAGAVLALKKMASATITLLKDSVNVAAQFEVLRLQFGVMIGDAERGKEVFESLWEVARELPFTIDEIARSAKGLMAWGVAGEDITITMKALADTAAFTGRSMEVMTNVIGRAWQTGGFLAKGPGAMLRGVMKTKMGIDSTKISVIEFQEALATMITDPKFGIAGMAQKMATTFIGIQSMIKDAITNIKVTIAESELFEEVKKTMEFILVFLKSDFILKKVKEIGTIASDVVKDFREKIISMIQSGQMKKLLTAWIKNIARWAEGMKDLIASLPALGEAFMNMIESLSIAFKEFFHLIGAVGEILSTFGIGETLHKQLIEAGNDLIKMEARFKNVNKSYESNQKLLAKYTEENSKALRVHGSRIKQTLLRQEGQLEVAKKDIELQQKKVQELIRVNAVLKKGIEFNFQNKKKTEENNEELGKMDKILKDVLESLKDIRKGFNFQVPAIQSISERWDAFMKQLEEDNKKIADIMTGAAKAMASSFENFFFDVMVGEFKSLQEYLNQFLRDMLRVIAQRLAMEAVMGIFGGGTTTSPAPGLNAGGVVPDITPIIKARDGFPQGIDTVPVLTTPGEMIMNKRQQGNLLKMLNGDVSMAGAKGGDTYVVNVNGAMDGADVFRTMVRNQQAMGAFMQKAKQGNVRGFF